jgi:hypothetical protein
VTTPTTVKVQLKLRQDTSSGWSAVNPILLVGELGRESNTGKIKIGDGSTAWNSLTYQPFGALITNDDISATAEIAVSKLADGAARQILQTDAAGTGVEWASNIDIPGTLDVTGAATFDATVTVTGDLTVNGTTTTISTQNLLVEDKNIIIGDVATPTDTTADGGGITLKGATDKTINWIDATDAWTSSERFSIPLGSAAAPSLTFTGDTNTGIYSPGADQVAISTNGTGRLFVDANGRVGVGTTSPAYNTHIKQSAALSYSLGLESSANDSRLVAGNVSSTWRVAATYDTTGSFQPITVFTSDLERIRITEAGLVGIGSSVPRSLLDCKNTHAYGTAAQDVIRITPNFSGGSSASASSMGAVTWGYDDGTTNLGRINVVSSQPSTTLASSMQFWIHNGSSFAQQATLTSTGLGIGATTVDERLHVSGGNIKQQLAAATNGGFNVNNGTNDLIAIGTGGFAANGGSVTDGGIRTTNSLVFATGSGAPERARIDSSGRLLVGTSTSISNALEGGIQLVGSGASAYLTLTRFDNGASAPAGIIIGRSKSATKGTNTAVAENDLLGAIDFTGANGSSYLTAARIGVDVDGPVSGGGANDMPGRLVFSTTADGESSPTERMRIQSDGAINLKTSTIAGNDGVRFNVGSIVIAGSAWNSGAGTNAVKWSSVSGALTWDSSSRLVKEDIENCPYGLSDLKMLKPRIYTRTDSGEKEIGFIADEVQSIIPEIVPTGPKSCITGNEDDAELIPISVNYDKFAAVLTKALQDAIGEIESLKARITALETP